MEFYLLTVPAIWNLLDDEGPWSILETHLPIFPTSTGRSLQSVSFQTGKQEASLHFPHFRHFALLIDWFHNERRKSTQVIFMPAYRKRYPNLALTWKWLGMGRVNLAFFVLKRDNSLKKKNKSHKWIALRKDYLKTRIRVTCRNVSWRYVTWPTFMTI